MTMVKAIAITWRLIISHRQHGKRIPLQGMSLQDFRSSRRGQAAPPYLGCWTTPLDRVWVPRLQLTLQLLQVDQFSTSQLTAVQHGK